jgi:diaminopimelate epimerase
MELSFVKMHGLGNDYVLFDMFDEATRTRISKVSDFTHFAMRVCDRHFGIGADGVLLAMPPKSKANDAAMRIINADGSEAEMCGNGIRCVSKFIIDSGYCKKKSFKIETMSGVKSIEVSGGFFRVDMGEPKLSRKDIPMSGKADSKAVNEPLQLKYKQARITAVSMGNPHAVLFMDDLDFDIEEMGKDIENSPEFPRRTNVEFVKVIGNKEIELRVWERGVGVTLACGTGACASVVASVLNEKTSRKVTVHLEGGDLLVEWGKDNHLYLSGPADTAFSGKIGV